MAVLLWLLVWLCCYHAVHPMQQKDKDPLHGIRRHQRHENEYVESLPLNYACSSHCPLEVIRPKSNQDISRILHFARVHNKTIVVRGGGHAYTCQSTSLGALMIDMRGFRAMRMTEVNHTVLAIEVGTGLIWDDVLSFIRQQEQRQSDPHQKLHVIHGQCANVGVAGFALHGGVHFGGLSELYGLASDNILALTVVVANGTIVRLSAAECVVDDVPVVPYSAACGDLWFALRGAGSSFGIVTSITFRVHRAPAIQSALTILSLPVPADHKEQEQFLSHYMSELPEYASVTLFGLDAYFKAYFFLLKFAQNKGGAIGHDPWSLIHSGDVPSMHFIVEATWTQEHGGLEPFNEVHRALQGRGGAVLRPWLSSERMWSVPSYDAVWGAGHAYAGASVTVHGTRHGHGDSCSAGAGVAAKTEQENKEGDSDSQESAEEKEEGEDEAAGDEDSPALSSSSSTPSSTSSPSSTSCAVEGIDDVGDVGQDPDRSATASPLDRAALRAVLDMFRSYRGLDGNDSRAQARAQPCSDCVTVVHRVGPGLRNRSSHSQSSSSFHPALATASLWMEMDCGHFHRQRASWPICSAFVDSAQRRLDASLGPSHRSHYPNVPSLATGDYGADYWGSHYPRLQAAKALWDADDVFSHIQSVRASSDHDQAAPHRDHADAQAISSFAGDEDSRHCRNLHDARSRGGFKTALNVAMGAGAVGVAMVLGRFGVAFPIR